MDEKTRFKMYKSGKIWVFSGLTAMSLGMGMTNSLDHVSASTIANSQQGSQSSDKSTNQSSVETSSDKSTNQSSVETSSDKSTNQSSVETSSDKSTNQSS